MPPPTLTGGRLQVFAVADTAAQVCWSGLAPGTEGLVGDVTVAAEHEFGAATFEGLEPARSYDVMVEGPRRTSLRTLVPPPGELLCRFVTVNDLHIGERRFGLLRTMSEGARPGDVDTYALRCA